MQCLNLNFTVSSGPNLPQYLLHRAPALFFLVVVRHLQILWQSHDYKHNPLLRLWGYIYDYALYMPTSMPKSIPMSVTKAIPLTKTIPMLVTSPITLPLVITIDAYLCLWPALSQCLWVCLCRWLWLNCSIVIIIVNRSATEVSLKDTCKSVSFQPQQGGNQEHIDGLVQDCSNSSAIAMELLKSCAKSSIFLGTYCNRYRDILDHLKPWI